jgi:SAM-dependent methyltransferase
MPTYTELDWYETPRYYDAIFDVDTADEVDFLEAVHVKHGTGRTAPAPGSVSLARPLTGPRVLEPACGSGRLLVQMAQRGWRVHGFDLEPAMVQYSRERLRAEGLAGTVAVGDMASFEVRGKFDLAHCFVSTFKYLLDEASARAHLQHVAAALVPGGIYALGFHLTDYAATKTTRERWHVVRDGAEVTCTIQGWPAERKSRREKVRSRLVVRESGKELRSETIWWFRTYDAREVRRLVRSVPELEHVATYDFLYDAEDELELSDTQYDTLLILKKRAESGTY